MIQQFSIDELIRHVGETSYTRGRAYFKRGRILCMEFSQGKINGKIVGTNNNIYSTIAKLDDNGKPFYSACSCPMESNCKHVAALYLAAVEKYKNSPLETQPNSAWQNAIQPLIKAGSTEKITTLKKLRLHFELTKKADYGYSYSKKNPAKWSLQIRPVTWNPETAKTRLSDLTWSDLRHLNQKRMEENHVLFLKLIAECLLDDHYSYGSKGATVQAGKAAEFWSIIRQSEHYGVLLYQGKKGDKPLELKTTAVSAKIIMKDDGQDLVLTPSLYLDQKNISGESVIIYGDTPAFAIVIDQSPLANDAFSLHPLEPETLVTVKEINFSKSLKIPATDLKKFNSMFLPTLSLKYQIENQSKKAKLLNIGSPKLRVNIQHLSANSLDIFTDFTYGDNSHVEINSVEQTVVDDQEQHLCLRDLKKEQLLLTRLSRFLTPLPRFNLSEEDRNFYFDQNLSVFDPQTNLHGDKMISFIKELLPSIADDPEIIINKSPDLKLPDEVKSIKIELTTEENKETNDWFDLGIIINLDGQKVIFQDIFVAIAENKNYFFLENGKYVSLASGEFIRLKALIEEARKLNEIDHNALSISRFQASLWDELKKLGIVTKQTEAWQKTMKGLLNFKSLESLKTPPSLIAELRHYQTDGFTWLNFLHEMKLGGILADDMGLGKTIQMIALLCKYFSSKNKGKKKSVLVIAPTSVVENWDSELKRFAPHLKVAVMRSGNRDEQYKHIEKHQIIITSYSLLARDLEKLKKLKFEMIIADEAQFVKNHQSKAYSAIRKLKAEVRFAMTGTPMENNIQELWAIFSIACPGLLGNPDYFKNTYRRPIEKGGDKEALEKLRKRIRPFLMRRKKELVAKELPPKTEQTLFLEMHDKHRQLYDMHLQRERQKILGLLTDGGLKNHRFQILSSLTKLRQLCLAPNLVNPDSEDIPSTKLDILKEQITEIVGEGHKVLIFSQFTKFLTQAKQTTENLKIKHLYLDGSTKNRQSLIKDFQSKDGPPVFLISLKAGGFGLNLTAADYCILLDPWWNPAVENQAVDRAHRIGQKRNVMIYKMILKNTIEEKVLKLQQKKQLLFQSVLEDGDTFASLITESDIKAILE